MKIAQRALSFLRNYFTVSECQFYFLKIAKCISILLSYIIVVGPRVRDDTFFRDLRSLTIILPNHDLRSLTIMFWKSHDRRSRSWSAIISPITINMWIKAMKTKSNHFYSISISQFFSGWDFFKFSGLLWKILQEKKIFSMK